MRIDLGCIAKGYIADLVMQQLKELGVTSALINLGGNVLTLGPAIHHEDGNWWIRVQNMMVFLPIHFKYPLVDT